MTIKQANTTIEQLAMKKKSMSKLTFSALSLSALLALSACSGGDNTAADAKSDSVSEAADTAVVEPEAPVAEPEVVNPEPVTEPEPTEAPVVEAETAEAVEVAAEPEVLAADAGAQLYEKQCKVCHEGGLLNAPKYGDKAAWSTHITKDKETLYMHSAKGFNKMPAQAINGVTEAQVHAAVDYMLASVS